jgi:thioredoxin reductase (NADPH)
MYKKLCGLLLSILCCFSVSLIAEMHDIDVAIIGGGPTGAASGLYVGGARLKGGAVIFDRNPGGAITGAYDVFNWPGVNHDSGSAIMDRFIAQVKALGVEFVDDVIESADFSVYPYKLVSAEHGIWFARSVIIATGSSPRRLNVPGEQEYWGCGVATCALCEAPLYDGMDVVVIGSGDSSVDKALHLAKYAKSVTVYVRGPQMRAKAIMQERLCDVKDRVKVIFNKEVVEVVGNGEKVVAIRLRDAITGIVEQIATDGVFLAIGHAPNSALFKDYLELTPSGYIVTRDGGVLTGLPGVFAAGTVTDVGQRYNQGFIAAGFGGQAGIEAVKYIRYEACRK